MSEKATLSEVQAQLVTARARVIAVPSDREAVKTVAMLTKQRDTLESELVDWEAKAEDRERASRSKARAAHDAAMSEHARLKALLASAVLAVVATAPSVAMLANLTQARPFGSLAHKLDTSPPDGVPSCNDSSVLRAVLTEAAQVEDLRRLGRDLAAVSKQLLSLRGGGK
jgi:hypothetical protein